MGRVTRGRCPCQQVAFSQPSNFLTSTKTRCLDNLQGPHHEESRTSSLQTLGLRRASRVSFGLSRLTLFCAATSRVLSRTLCTTLDAALHSPKLFSETCTDTGTALSISSLLKECTPANSSTLAQKVSLSFLAPLLNLIIKQPLLRSEMCFPSAPCPKAQSFPTLNASRATAVPLPVPRDAQPSSLVTPKTATRLASDFHRVSEEPSRAPAEAWWASSLADKEPTSHS